MADERDNSYTDDDVTDDEGKHSQLIEAIGALDAKKKSKIIQRFEPVSQVSEFSVTAGKDQVKLHELVKVVQKSGADSADLKKKLEKVQKPGKLLQTPLPRHEKQQIERNIAYDAVSKELGKWDSVVQKNRNADQLEFPLSKPDLRLVTSEKFTQRFQPRTPLEMEIAALLSGNKHSIKKEKFLTPAEERAMKAMSLSEAKERRAELQKYRALMSYKEAKARRQKKIKSKRYHKILRKEKEKQQKLGMQGEHGESELGEMMEAANKTRIKERMDLRHRGGSKFMAKQTMYGKYNKEVRSNVQDMLHKSRDLSRKVEGAEESESEESEDGVDVQIESGVSGPISTANPWMQVNTKSSSRSEAKKQPETKASESESSDEEIGDVENDKIEIADDSADFGAKTEDNTEVDIPNTDSLNLSLKRKKTLEDLENDSDEEVAPKVVSQTSAPSPSKKAKKPRKKRNKSKSQEPEAEHTIVTSNIESAVAPDIMSDSDDDNEQDKRMTIAQAFEDDDVVNEFIQEKKSTQDNEKVKDIDLTLPGWGSWGGSGIKPSKKKKSRFVIKAPPAPPRKDALKDGVIISETKDTAVTKYQVNNLPFPFNNVHQFENSIQQPLGKTWNSETAYKKMIQPKVRTKAGTIIEPIDKSETFKGDKGFKNKPQEKGNKNKRKKNN